MPIPRALNGRRRKVLENFADMTARKGFGNDFTVIEGYDDGYATTMPVGSFKRNAFELYD